MIQHELTNASFTATPPAMQETSSDKRWSGRRAARALIMVVGCSLALSGCISINAPDKPIVIELNIAIKQEVIYRLADDAGNTIDANPEIF